MSLADSIGGPVAQIWRRLSASCRWLVLVATLGALSGPGWAGCRRVGIYVGDHSDDDLVEQIGRWEQHPVQYGQELYVRPPGQEYGASDGSSWSNALSGLPESLERGSRYWLASGEYYQGPPQDRYHSILLDDPEDGDLSIAIVKATVAEHGDASDWWNDLDDGPARLGPVAILTGGYSIDGGALQQGREKGIQIHTRDCSLRAEAREGAPLAFLAGGTPARISLRRLDIADCAGPDAPGPLDAPDVIFAAAPVTQLSLRSCSLRGARRSLLHLEGAFDVLVELCDLQGSGDGLDPYPDSAAVFLGDSRNVVVRRCWISNVEGSFFHLRGARNIIISANVLTQTDPQRGLLAAFYSDSPALGVLLAGNTLFNLSGVDVGVVFDGPTADLEVANNLWAGCRAEAIGLDGDHHHNAFFDNRRPGGEPGLLGDEVMEPGVQVLDLDPFVDSAAPDLALAVPTEPGASILDPFVGVGYGGMSRGIDGVWDRGAYEYLE